MRHLFFAILFLVAIGGGLTLDAAETPVELPRIGKNGRLGVPLQTQASVVAEIVRAEDVGHKKMVGDYLLQINKVDGIELHPKPVFRFSFGPDVPTFPTDCFSLYKQKTGKSVEELPEEDLKLAEKDFIGKTMTYLAKEIPVPAKTGKNTNTKTEKPDDTTLLLIQLLDPP